MSKRQQPKAITLTNTRWKRIQTPLVPSNVCTRQEIYEENYRREAANVRCQKIRRYEDIGIQARLKKAAELEKRKKHEALQDAQVLETEREYKREVLERADHLDFRRNACVKNFHQALHVVKVKNENEKLRQLKQEKDKAQRKQDKELNKEMRDRLAQAEEKEQEKARKRLLANKAHLQALSEQIKSKEQQREIEKQMKKKEKDKVKQLELEYAQELKIQAEKASESKSKLLKGLHEQVAAQKQQKELNKQRLKAEEEHRQHCQAVKEKRQQKAKEVLGRTKNQQQVLPAIAVEKLAASLQQQAKKQALLDKKAEKIRADKEREKEENEKIQQQKQKQKRKSINDSNRAIILRKQQEKKMQQKTDQKWTSVGETLENIHEKEKQKRREEVFKAEKANSALIAEKRARSAEEKRAERERALKAEEQVKVKRERLRQYVKTELPKVRKEDLPIVLETSLGGHGVLVDGEMSEHLTSKAYFPLPRYSTAQTRLVRFNQELNELDKKPVIMGKIHLPKLQGPPRRPFSVKELVGDLTTQSKPVAPNKQNLTNSTLLPPIKSAVVKGGTLTSAPPIKQLKRPVLPPVSTVLRKKY